MDANSSAALEELSRKKATPIVAWLRDKVPGIRFKPTERYSLVTAVIPMEDIDGNGHTHYLSRNVSKDVFLDEKQARTFFVDVIDTKEEYQAKVIGYRAVDELLFGGEMPTQEVPAR